MKALGKALAFVVALALVGAGTATAASMITGKQIENGTVTGADIKKETLSGKHLTDAAKDKLKGATATRSRRSTDLDPAGAIPGCPGGANVQVRTYDPSLVAYQDDGFRLILSSN